MITRHAQRSPRSFLAVFLTAILAALAVLQPVKAESQGDQEAIAAMENWLSSIDEGKYALSWRESAASFQKALSSKTWEEQLAAVRKPLGPVLSRELKSSQFQTEVASPTGAVKGEFIVAQFATSFANLKSAIETVCFERQGGKWKASGYYIKPG